MFRRFENHSIVFCVALALLVMTSSLRAQFKDLDQLEGDPESQQIGDLTPSGQPFVEPTELSNEQPQAASAQGDGMPELAPPQQSSPRTATPEPIPMPELQDKVKPTVKAPETLREQPKTEAQDDVANDDEPDAPESPWDSFSKHPPSPSASASEVIETAQFRGIRPGVSNKLELEKSWGEPAASMEHADSTTLVYQFPLFKQIEVAINENDIVSGIVVHLESDAVVGDVAKGLALVQLEPVPIPDEFGDVLGQAYPESGLLLSFAEGLENLRVATILIEPISSEVFRLRAQYDFGHHYERSLADLDQAIKLDPQDAEAHWLRAQFLDVTGKTREAIKSVQKAIRLKPTNPLFRLTRARLYAKTNRIRTGMDEVKEVIRELDLPAEVSGRAHNLLGDMYAMGKTSDHQQALKHHLQAIDASVKAVSDRRFAVRRAAKHVLVNAHVSVARDIAMGNFQRQSEVVPKWLLRATEMADEFISDDQGDDLLQMQIFRDTLASYSELKEGNFDAAVAIDEALKTGREMISDASDHYYKIQIERMLAEALFHAAKIHRTRGRYDTAMKFANNALGLLDGSKEEWELVAHDQYLEAQLLFLVGSVYAVRDSNHFEAVEYYSKARDIMATSSSLTSPLYSDRSHGEMYVSMGLSYWETNEQEEAIQLTLQGATIMKDAVEEGTLELDAMSVPYGNLAAMHGSRGNSSKSQEFGRLVARIDEIGKKRR